MKRFLFFWLSMGTVTLGAQTVVIPDAVLKNKLVNTSCADFNDDGIYDGDVDTNNDGEIQLSEAQVVLRLKLNNTSLPNPNAFTNATGLNAFTACRELNVAFNQLTQFNIAMPSLEILKVNNNALNSLTLNGLGFLNDLDCSQNNLNTLDLQPVALLESLRADFNPLGTVNLEFTPELAFLSLQSCSLSALNLSSTPGIIFLKLSDNSFTPNLNTLVNLKTLIVRNMGLQNLDLSSNTNLLSVDLSQNSFSSFVFPLAPSLNSVTISSCPNLSSINLNSLKGLTFLECNNNPSLQFIFAKNGQATYQQLSLNGLSELQYICSDSGAFDDFEIALGTSTVPVNDYCTIPPGGNYNTIRGTARWDAGQNGCDLNDFPIRHLKLKMEGGANYATFTTNDGSYALFPNTGVNYTLSPWVENTANTTVTPSQQTIAFSQVNGQEQVVDVCLSPNGIYHDVEVAVAPLYLFQPGTSNTLVIVLRNKGNQVSNGTFSLNYDASRCTYLNATAAPSQSGGGLVTWNYTGLQPWATQAVYVQLAVNAETDTIPVLVGDTLPFQTTVSPSDIDQQPIDDTFVIEQPVIDSFEPNSLLCLQGPQLPTAAIGSYLHYMINFENTGASQAAQVVVRLEINGAEFDVDSWQILDTSAPSVIRQKDALIDIFFPNLQIDTGGHGNVLMRIRSKNSLGNGDTVNNRADIFFDYNLPLNTGITQTVYQDLSLPETADYVGITIAPNPVVDLLSINASAKIKKIEVYDSQGRLLQIRYAQGLQEKLDFQQKASGVYWIKVDTENGSAVKKLIKN